MWTLLVWAGEFYLACVLSVSGVTKLAYPTYFQNAIRNNSFIPNSLASIILRWLPIFEIGLSIFLAIGTNNQYVGFIALVLFVIFFVYKHLSYRKNKNAMCGCGIEGRTASSASMVVSVVYIFVAWAVQLARTLSPISEHYHPHRVIAFWIFIFILALMVIRAIQVRSHFQSRAL
jgi:uncharacterized membrane protein YphA (DoxX/SURF4 family)